LATFWVIFSQTHLVTLLGSNLSQLFYVDRSGQKQLFLFSAISPKKTHFFRTIFKTLKIWASVFTLMQARSSVLRQALDYDV
jgi:hypothetical protein